MNGPTIITIVVVIFLLFVITLTLREVINLIICQVWPAVDGVILDSGTVESGSETSTYSAGILYEYEVEGRKYKSRRVAFMRWWGSEKYAKRVVDKYPVKTTVKVYYKPSNHKISILEKNTRISDICLTILILIIISYGGYLGVRSNI
jgi:hypothetical protein